MLFTIKRVNFNFIGWLFHIQSVTHDDMRYHNSTLNLLAKLKD